MQIHLIWAQDRAGAIGKSNALPWHIPEDLAHFKQETLGFPLVMGRKTFESLPSGALPGRQNIVLTRSKNWTSEGAVKARSLRGALEMAATSKPFKVFVIGGGEVFEQALPLADFVHCTEVDLVVPGADSFAPRLVGDFSVAATMPWTQSKVGPLFRITTYAKKRY